MHQFWAASRWARTGNNKQRKWRGSRIERKTKSELLFNRCRTCQCKFVGFDCLRWLAVIVSKLQQMHTLASKRTHIHGQWINLNDCSSNMNIRTWSPRWNRSTRFFSLCTGLSCRTPFYLRYFFFLLRKNFFLISVWWAENKVEKKDIENRTKDAKELLRSNNSALKSFQN